MEPDALHMSPHGAIVLLTVLVAVYVFYECFFSPLARIPGPFVAKITWLYYPFISRRGRIHRELVDLHKTYGTVVRISPNALSVGDPMAFREIYRAGNKFYKSQSYSVLQGTRPFDLAGQRDEKIHSEQRRLVARSYSMDSMVYLEPHVDTVINALVDRLKAFHGQPIDLGYWMQLFAVDVIGSISFSRPFGYVEVGEDNGIFLRIQRALRSIGWIRHAPQLYRWHQKLMPYIGNWLAANDRNTYFFEFATREVQARTDRGGDYKDIAGQLLSVQKEKPDLNDTNIAFMMTTNVFAGSDTTSTSLRAIIYLLLKHPEKYDRLVEELESKRQKGELSLPVTFKQAESCAYLQAIIYEAMRLYPAAGDILDRDVPPGGMTINGHYVPAGVVVGTSAWVIHRVLDIWGPDAEEFLPERWLDKGNENNLKRFFFAFGGGSRTCIGRNISWLEISKLVPTLLMCFDMRLADKAELTEECGSLVFLSGLKVHVAPKELDRKLLAS
ncbi:cytochrome P450 [Annulohypoxylon maeteangense]|uniref:cytochrome P450 n=1 Tax=Annulohypoxylon maeteangense TaxID=1927788 RepID=UPI002007E7CE|nr:cytochrome P450 [Annulohypoxylon maeteangense]KAI0882395.1 cytochrome P450 [Annulohypoxylon maeteangense]